MPRNATKAPSGKPKRREPRREPLADITETHKNYSLDKKAAFLQEVKETEDHGVKPNIASLAVKYEIPYSVARRALGSRDKILKLAGDASIGYLQNTTRVRAPKNVWIEGGMNRWMKAERALGNRVTEMGLAGAAAALYRDASRFARRGKKRKMVPIALSNGFLHRFKKKYGIKQYTGHGESGSVDLEEKTVKARLEEIREELSAFTPDCIYNCDETGLYLRESTNKTLDYAPIKGRKITRDARVSILLTCNATGSDKRPLLILAKNKPRNLSIEMETRVETDFTGKGYMREPVFLSWLNKFNVDMATEGKFIALLMDSAPGHGNPEDENLSNIKIIRLPPGTTSKTQPLDAGVIRSFKAHYTRWMLIAVSLARSKAKNSKATATVAKLWDCLPDAWVGVSEPCIRNCFMEVPLFSSAHRQVLADLGVETVEQEIKRLCDELHELFGIDNEFLEKQKNRSLLNYLKVVFYEEPSESVEEAVQWVVNNPDFKHIFEVHDENDTRFEDDDDSDEVDSEWEGGSEVFSSEANSNEVTEDLARYSRSDLSNFTNLLHDSLQRVREDKVARKLFHAIISTGDELMEYLQSLDGNKEIGE